MVLASPTEIQQILMNLATNAFLAMQEKGGTLEISLADVDLEQRYFNAGLDMVHGDYLQLTVSDTGTGMSPEVAKRIFEPFFTTREVGKGTGMGLSVVYGIVKDLQGMIAVESKPDAGSVFRVFLPKVDADVQERDATASGIIGGKERILFVDDEELLVEWGRVTLERLGYKVTSLANGTEAMKIFRANPFLFDLVITDQTMPGMSGIQLASKLLAIRHDLPIILCTGHSDAVSPESAKEVGVREYLMKPLSRKELAGAVRKVLDKTRE
jgi:CheY-like chemotaxis protein